MAEVEFVISARKARWSINKGQLDLLSDWMGGCAGLRLSRRAWFILSEQQGFPVHRYFQATPVPSRRIQALMQQFDRLGPFGLIERARSGRPNAPDQSWTARRTSSGEHWVLVRNVALEGGRRRTRTLKLKMPRARGSAPVLALALDHEVLIVVVQTEARRRRDLPMVGQCLTMGEYALAHQNNDGTLMDWREYLLRLSRPDSRQLGIRVSAEQRRPFVNILQRLVGNGTGICFHFIAPSNSKRLLAWMAAFGEVFDSPDLSGLLREANFATGQSISKCTLSELFDTELSKGIEEMLARASSTFYWIRDHEHAGDV